MSGHFVDGQWTSGDGDEMRSVDASSGELCWTGPAATSRDVDLALAAARRATGVWNELPLARRADVLRAFVGELDTWREELARPIALETGRPLWDARDEVAGMVSSATRRIEALLARHARTSTAAAGGKPGVEHRPHGVLCAITPSSVPARTANDALVPALLSGNAVVLKPGERVPLVSERLIELWERAGLPAGTLNLVQGGSDVGAMLAAHAAHDGVLFTGSHAVARALARTLADRPEIPFALDFGGNNAVVVHHVQDFVAAADIVIRSAYRSTGRRCTAARRLVVVEGSEADGFLAVLAGKALQLPIGAWQDQPEPFLGPAGSEDAATRVLEAQARLLVRGARALAPVERHARVGGYLTPGLLDVSRVAERDDEEIFGPLLQVVRVPDFDAAIGEVNRTRRGKVAALVSDRRDLYARFRRRARAGRLAWNLSTVEAADDVPPESLVRGGDTASDSCALAVTSLERPTLGS